MLQRCVEITLESNIIETQTSHSTIHDVLRWRNPLDKGQQVDNHNKTKKSGVNDCFQMFEKKSSKLMVWRSQNPPIESQTPPKKGPIIVRE